MRNRISRMVAFGGSLAALSLIGLSAPQQAQAQVTTGPQRILGALLSTGGYWFTSASATRALGTPKFYNQQALHGHSAGLGGFRVTGGFEFIQITDHFFPFTSGNSLSYYGVSARATTPSVSKFRPYATVGLYVGVLDSKQLGYSSTSLVPSLAIGAEYKINRIVTLALDYRVSGQIGSVNTDGFSLSVRIF